MYPTKEDQQRASVWFNESKPVAWDEDFAARLKYFKTALFSRGGKQATYYSRVGFNHGTH